MLFPQITILSREEAQRVLRSSHGDSITHVISLSEPEQEPPVELALHNGRHLILQFHDVTNTKYGYVPPTSKQVEGIIRFAHSIKPEHRLLCHCAAGISRSSAAALTVLASKLKPGPTSAHAA